MFLFFYFLFSFFKKISFLKNNLVKIRNLLIIFISGKIMSKRVAEHSELPTDFAIDIAKKYKIYPDVDEKDFVALRDREDKLKMFQQMSISSSFEETLLAYYDRTFSDEQLQALKLIYRATASWLKGEVVGTLIGKIKNTKITNKDFAESISTILEQLESKTEDGNQKATKKTNGLAIKLTK